MHIADALQATECGLDEELVPAICRAATHGLARSLPDTAVAGYLECRPGSGFAQVDFLACCIEPSRLVPGSFDDPRSPGWILADRIQALRRDPQSSLHRVSPLIWLEFDDVLRPDPDPSTCVCLQSDYVQRAPNGTSDTHGATEVAHALAGLGALPHRTAATVLRCLRLLDDRSHAVHLSTMTARAEAPAKLYVRMPPGSVRRWLGECGWTGNETLLSEVLRWREPEDEFVHVDLTVCGDTIPDRLGMAFPRDTDGERFSEDIYRTLAGLGGCPAEVLRAAGALRRWTQRPDPWHRWRGWPWALARWVDQKLVFDHHVAELKAYLALRPVPLLGGA